MSSLKCGKISDIIPNILSVLLPECLHVFWSRLMGPSGTILFFLLGVGQFNRPRFKFIDCFFTLSAAEPHRTVLLLITQFYDLFLLLYDLLLIFYYSLNPLIHG